MRQIFERIEASPLGYRLAKGAFWSLGGAVISRGLGLLSAILVGRFLGKEEYGELGIIQNTVGMFGTLAGFGMGLTANKYVAEYKSTDPARAGRIIALASATAWISSGIMAVGLVAFGPWLAAKTLAAPHLAGLLQFGALLLLLSGVNGAQTGALSGFEAFKSIARINLVSGLLTFPLMVIGALQWGVTGAVAGLVGSQFVNCLMSYFALRAEAARFNIPHRYAGCFADLGVFWRFSLPAVLIGLLNSVVAWGAGALVVNQLGGYGEMGIYNAVLRVKQIPDAVLAMLVAPVIPMLSEAFGKSDQSSYQKTLRMFLLLSTLAIVPVSLLQTAAPDLTLLPFGREYSGHPFVVGWLMLHAVLTSLGTCVGYILVTAGRLWLVWLLSLVFAACYAVLAMVLVPRHGVVGYAASLAIAYGASTAVSMVVLYRAYPETMRHLRWGRIALLSVSLFAACSLASICFSFPGALAAGVLAAAVFVILGSRIFRPNLAPSNA